MSLTFCPAADVKRPADARSAACARVITISSGAAAGSDEGAGRFGCAGSAALRVLFFCAMESPFRMDCEFPSSMRVHGALIRASSADAHALMKRVRRATAALRLVLDTLLLYR